MTSIGLTIYRSLVVTHQARLRCLLHEYLTNNTKPSTPPKEVEQEVKRVSSIDSVNSGTTDVEDIDSDMEPETETERLMAAGGSGLDRFQNGCVIKMTINTNELTISLVVNGTIDEEKKDYVYYVMPGTTDQKAADGKYQIKELYPVTIVGHKYKDLIGPSDQYEFYLVRHGQAEHNVLSGFKKMFSSKNTKLTIAGIKQAIESGEMFMKSKGVPSELGFLFVSDLSRTSETMNEFMKAFKSELVVGNKQAVVLPCSHELKYTKNSKCDGNQGITANENTSTCDKPGYCKGPTGLELDWADYNRFYGTGSRRRHGSNSRKCRDTDMIREAIQHIKAHGHSQTSQGGTRKTRQRTKWTKKYKASIRCNRPKGFSQRQHCKYSRRKYKTRRRAPRNK